MARLCHELVEELVLRPFEPCDLFEDVRLVAAHGLGVTFGLAVILSRQRCLGHQGPEVGVARSIGKLCQLLVGHVELFAELTQPTSDLTQPSLDRCLGHAAIVRVASDNLRLDRGREGLRAAENLTERT